MVYSKSWFDDSGELWVAENINRGEHHEVLILREFHYAFAGTDLTQDTLNEMQHYVKNHFPSLDWLHTSTMDPVAEMRGKGLEFGLIGIADDDILMRITVSVDDMIVTKILVERDF